MLCPNTPIKSLKKRRVNGKKAEICINMTNAGIYKIICKILCSWGGGVMATGEKIRNEDLGEQNEKGERKQMKNQNGQKGLENASWVIKSKFSPQTPILYP